LADFIGAILIVVDVLGIVCPERHRGAADLLVAGAIATGVAGLVVRLKGDTTTLRVVLLTGQGIQQHTRVVSS
jgi:hypothetical protein